MLNEFKSPKFNENLKLKVNVKYSPHGRFFFVLMFFASESMSFKAIFRNRPSFYHQALAFMARAWFGD
jgi:hypothetical protein